jgi:hypothetical protein
MLQRQKDSEDNMSILNNKNYININEILGLRINNTQTINRLTHIPASLNYPNEIRKIRKAAKLLQIPGTRCKVPGYMDDWQIELTKMILTSRQDILVNVMPAAGKTAPLINGWACSFTCRHNKKKLDKILWICPTVQLSNQVYHQDLKPKLFEILREEDYKDILNIIPEFSQRPNMFNNNYNITPDDFNFIQNQINNYTALRTGSGQNGTVTNKSWFVVCTYEFAPDIIKTQQPDIVVIDELQQYIPIDLPNQNTDTSNTKAFIKTLDDIPQNTCLILLTGSMNKNSSQFIIDKLRSVFDRNIRPLFYTPHARNRAHISLFPHDKLDTQEEIIQNIVKNVNNRDIGNAYIMFSVQSEKSNVENKKAIIPIANKLIKELPWRSIKQVAGINPEVPAINSYTDLPNISPFEDPNSDYRNPKNRSYYDKQLRFKEIEKDNRKERKLDALDYLNKDREDPLYIANRLQIMLNQEFIEQNPVYKNQLNNYDDNKNRPDFLLAKCILCGFAYIAGGSDRNRKLENADINLVQTLFKQKKIYAIMASDMIGVGTTLTVHNLYIPNLSKRSDGLFKSTIDDSSLVQLINRVGRQGDISANIYCASSEFNRIYKLLNNPSYDAVEAIPFGKGKTAFEKEINKYDIVDFMISLFKKKK